MTKYRLITPVCLLICLFFYTSSSFSATYYIDYAGGSDSNSGLSTSSPWKHSPGMNGFSGRYSHTAGDRFVFKGGVTWPSATLPLTISYSGTPGKNDVYTSHQAWYAGTSWTRPVFNGENNIGRYTGLIESLNKQYFTIEYIRITGSGLEGATDDQSYGMKIVGTGLNDITIQYMQLVPYSKSNLVLSACGKSATTTGLVIQYNDFQGAMNNIEMGCTDNTSTVDGMIIRGNSFSNYSQLSKGDHPDGIHFHNKGGALRRFSNVEISGNKFYGVWKESNTAQIYFEDAVCSARIFNNVFSISNANGKGGYIFSPGQIAVYGSDHVEIYNNTFCTDTIGGSPNWPLSHIIFSAGLSRFNGKHTVKGNIFSGARNAIIYNPSMTMVIDYNLYSLNFGGSPGKWDANSKTASQWQAAGNDVYGIFKNPKFIRIPDDLRLQPASPARASFPIAQTPKNIFNTDFSGFARPQTRAWDMGAYQSNQ